MQTTPLSSNGRKLLYDREQAERFIEALRGEANASVSWATFPDGEGESSHSPQTYYGTIGDLYERLATASDAGHGIFVTVNETDGVGRKTENIVRVRALFADEDEGGDKPRVNVGALRPTPTMVVRSGGGRHLYWVVTDAARDDFTRAQKGIAKALGTDPLVNDLPRLMRCPGFPHLKDRSNPKPVYIESTAERAYMMSEVLTGLGVCLEEAVAAPEAPCDGRVFLSDAVNRAREYIEKIEAVEGNGGDLATFKAAAALLNDFALDDSTAWALLCGWNKTNARPPWSEAALAKKFASAKRNGRHQLGAALNAGRGTEGRVTKSDATPPASDVPEEVAALNDEWFVLDESGKLFVCRLFEDTFANGQRRRRLVRYSFPDFKRKHENRLVAGRELGDAWLEWPGRRQYDRAVFDPTGETRESDVLNLWTGWPIEPAPGDWGMIRRHIVDVVCAGNRECADYLIHWMARLFQKPSEPGFVVPVLRGKEGAGKSVLGVAIRRALGQYGLAVSNPHHVVGNFNAHLRDLLFLEASEAFFAGDRGQANQLKALITDDLLVIEAKGVDAVTVPNMLHVFMTTNESWAIAAGPESRRYFVLDVSDAKRGNTEYFKALFAQVKDDRAIAAMLHYMLALDLSNFNVQKFPVTQALLDQRERSLSGVLAWALDLASREAVDTAGGRVEWRPFFSTRHELYEDYRAWVGRSRREREISAETFGRALTNELGLPWKRECPRDLWGKVPESLHGKTGYWVGTVEEFRVNARRAAGVDVQGCDDFTESPEAGNACDEALPQGFQGSQHCRELFVPDASNDAQGSSRTAA